MYEDITKECVQCKKPFLWTAGEQKFMQGLLDDGKITEIREPKRCPDCRKKKKDRMEREQNRGGSY